MLRTLFWVAWLFLYLLRSYPKYRRVLRLQKEGREEERRALVLEQVGLWSSRLLHNTGIRLTVTGRENLPPADEAVMFVSNHQSYIDIPVLLAGLDFPRPLLSKRAIGQVPGLGAWMRQLGCIFVERDDLRSSMEALKKGEAQLKNGGSLIVCPEGTRSRSDEMGEFKPGAVRMAVKAGVRIVPLAIDGSYQALEGNGNRLTKCDVRLVILPPVDVAALDKAGQKALNGHLQEMIRAAKDDRSAVQLDV